MMVLDLMRVPIFMAAGDFGLGAGRWDCVGPMQFSHGRFTLCPPASILNPRNRALSASVASRGQWMLAWLSNPMLLLETNTFETNTRSMSFGGLETKGTFQVSRGQGSS